MNDIKRPVLVSSKAVVTCDDGLLSIVAKEEKTLLCFDQIQCILLENGETTISMKVLLESTRKGIPVVICNEKHQPFIQLLPFAGNFASAGSLAEQIHWKEERTTSLVDSLLTNKLHLQKSCLLELGKSVPCIFDDMKDPRLAEGPAAKAYFHCLFGPDFSRDSDSSINAMLNYGYALLASSISQEIVTHGYSTQIGIYHHANTNPFNLTYDLIEPFRPFVDRYVRQNLEAPFDFSFKSKCLARLFASKVKIGNRSFALREAISEFVQNALSYLSTGKKKPVDVDFG